MTASTPIVGNDANQILVTVIVVTTAVIISILLTVLCVEKANKLKKKKKAKSSSSSKSEPTVTIDPQPASVMPASTYIDISTMDTSHISLSCSKSPLPSPSVTSVQTNLSRESTSTDLHQSMTKSVTKEAYEARKYVPIKAPPLIRALSATSSFSTSLETIEFTPRTFINRYSLALGPRSRMSIAASEINYLKQIGGGNFGKVYLAKWQATKVAVKVTIEEEGSSRFQKELDLMMHLTPHPNIVQILGFSHYNTCPVIVMEYCAGGSLLSHIKETPAVFPTAKIVRILFGVARGMLHLHKSNIVHRDLAARNVLLTKEGEPKLSDFGFSRMLKTTRGRSRDSIGPLFWMSPEVIRTGFFTKKLDVWSFGCVIYELLARKEPFEGEDLLQTGFRIRDENLTPSLENVTCESESLMTLMKQCWSIDPDARPDFQAICDVLENELSLFEPESYRSCDSAIQAVSSLYSSKTPS